MLGKKPDVSPLALRKQLLLAESEVNRAQFGHELRHLVEDSRTIGRKVQSVCSTIASYTSMGLAGFNAFKDIQAERANGKSSWFSTVVNGVRIGAALWKSFRSRP